MQCISIYQAISNISLNASNCLGEHRSILRTLTSSDARKWSERSLCSSFSQFCNIRVNVNLVESSQWLNRFLWTVTYSWANNYMWSYLIYLTVNKIRSHITIRSKKKEEAKTGIIQAHNFCLVLSYLNAF